MDLSLIALIGIVLLMGIVKKNAIMIIDFRVGSGARTTALSPHDAIVQASLLRFRPIMMTTLAALCSARCRLRFATGTGSELRNPLGISIVGGLLLLSQLITLYTTPVIYVVDGKPAASGCSARVERARSADRSEPPELSSRIPEAAE